MMLKTNFLIFIMYVSITTFCNADSLKSNLRTKITQTAKTELETQENGMTGLDLLNGIRNIISADPNVPSQEVQYKPFVGSFSTIKEETDPSLLTTSYCMTDNACQHWEAYNQQIPLTELSCNSFCYISKDTGKYVKSNIYTTDNAPESYLNCCWETCN